MKLKEVKTTTVKKTTTKIYLNDKEIIESLTCASDDFIKLVQGAKSVKVYVKIGGGGDYSNTNIDIETSTPIVIEIEKEE